MIQVNKVNRLKKILLFICLLSLTGCANKLFYNTLPFWVDYYVSDFIDMTDKQQKRFDADIKNLHQWHKDVELPKLNALIEQVEQEVIKGVSLEDVVELEAQIKIRLIALLKRYQPSLIQLLQSLSDDQVKHLLIKIDEKMHSAQKKRLSQSVEKQKYEYLNRLFKRANFWIGRIDNSQKPLFIPLMNNHFEMLSIFTDMNLQIRNQFEQLLVQRHQENFNQALGDFLQKIIQRRGKDHQAQWADYKKTQRVFIHTLALALTPKQKKHLLKKLQSMQNDLADLMR